MYNENKHFQSESCTSEVEKSSIFILSLFLLIHFKWPLMMGRKKKIAPYGDGGEKQND
jgi:hypothetical protein